jgi:glutathione-regulated potassium-efflux system ancillary protein KefG
MSSILILFAHPLLEKSRVQMEMAKAARTVKGVTFIDLYELYPDFDIDIKREQQLLLNHDLVIWQHPFYWYSAPPILKQWQDLVLEHGWAYGKSGNALKGKKILNAISSGGGMDAYTEQGYNRFSLHDFLKPYDQTAYLCKMNYLPPFWVPGVHRMNMDMIRKYALQYKNILTALSKDIFSDEEIMQCNYLNDLIPISSIQ